MACSASLRLATILALVPAAGPAAVIVLEAETGRLVGVEVVTARPGLSGTGYVTGFDADDDRVEFEVEVPAGLYAVSIRYALEDGEKGFDLEINCERRSGMMTRTGGDWHECDAGPVILPGGPVRIAVGKGWGWWEFDRITLTPTTLVAVPKPPARLANPRAGAAAKALFRRLVAAYGDRTLAGQQDQREIDYARSVTGRAPALGSFDFMDCSPSRVERGADGTRTVEQAIAWGRAGGVVQMMWHWNAPADLLDREGQEWWRGFYTEATTFDLAAALADPKSDRYRLLVRDLDAIAGLLARFQAAGIPVLWRPLHEAQGGWFWWGAKGPEAFKAFWRLMFDRFTRHHGLHELIWVYGPPGGGLEAADWYPGDDVVDAIGPSVYADATSSLAGEWETLRRLYGGRKLVGLSECGAPPDPGRERAYGVRWSWFSVWSGRFVRDIPPDRLRAIYDDPDVVTLERWTAKAAR
ncbi:MAG: glycosyl hydrolase [Candidatus Coatesbacteria bacterium]